MTDYNHNGYPVFNYTVEYRIAGWSNRTVKTQCDATTLKALKRRGRLVRIITKREVLQNG